MTSPVSPQPGNQDERHGRAQLTALCTCGHYQDLHDTPDEADPHGGECVVWRQVEYGRLYCPCPVFCAAAAVGQTGAGEEADDVHEQAVAAFEADHREQQTVYEAHEWTSSDPDTCARCDVEWGDADATCAESAPSAGQDTGQMRDERCLPELRDALCRYLDDQADYADRGDLRADFAELWGYLDGPLRQLIAERRCGRCGQIPYVHGLPDSTCVYEPTQAAGQDTERLRDELFVGSSIHIHRAGESCNTHCNTPDHPYRKALAELDQTRRERDELMREVERLVDIGSQWGRERDEARAQVQRVEAEVSWLRKADWIPGVSAQLATSVAVRRLRRALDGET